MLKQEIVFNIFIAVLSVLGLFDIIYTFTGVSAQLGILYPSGHVLLNIIGFVAISFIWSREKWANWLFLGVILAHLGLDLLVGGFQPMKLLLLVPAIFFFLTKR
jgi:hypothetical protein